MKAVLPVVRDAFLRAGRGLVERMRMRRGKLGSIQVVAREVIPEPVLARLEALGQAVTGRVRVLRAVLRRRGVAAS